jgi:hypothetical protein
MAFEHNDGGARREHQPDQSPSRHFIAHWQRLVRRESNPQQQSPGGFSISYKPTPVQASVVLSSLAGPRFVAHIARLRRPSTVDGDPRSVTAGLRFLRQEQVKTSPMPCPRRGAGRSGRLSAGQSRTRILKSCLQRMRFKPATQPKSLGVGRGLPNVTNPSQPHDAHQGAMAAGMEIADRGEGRTR